MGPSPSKQNHRREAKLLIAVVADGIIAMRRVSGEQGVLD
jgi:hypothetical protein